MANTYIIELNSNDSLIDVIRKVNQNLKLLSANQTRQTKASIRQESSRLDLVVAETIIELDKLKQELKEAKSSLIPDIGTYIFSTSDPNEKWPETVWERIADGTFLMAAGDEHEEGEEYGENEVTLTSAQLPAHNHGVNTNTTFTVAGISGNGRSDIPGGTASWGSRTPAHWFTITTASTGNNEAHNNIPKSIAIPLWCRVE